MATAAKWFREQPALQEAGVQSFPITLRSPQAATLSASAARAAAAAGERVLAASRVRAPCLGQRAVRATRSSSCWTVHSSQLWDPAPGPVPAPPGSPSPSEAFAAAFPMRCRYASATIPRGAGCPPGISLNGH